MKQVLLFNCFVLALFTANAQTNLFPADGNVGIGTITPSEKFHLQGSTTAIKMNPDFHGVSYMFTHNGTAFTPLVVQSSNMRFVTGASGEVEAIRILENGNIGIGVGVPQAGLEIAKSYSATNSKALRLFYQGSWSDQQYASNYRFLDVASSEGGKILQLNGYGMGIGFDPPAYNSPDKLYINGNVGIGTTTPGEKLAVNGNVRAREIKVETANWPDYVFKPSYRLMPLSKIEDFIKQNGHLPEVPSAKEVSEKGIEVGANQAVLLKKIEELTLHLIEMEKKVMLQEGKIKQQERVMRKLATKK